MVLCLELHVPLRSHSLRFRSGLDDWCRGPTVLLRDPALISSWSKIDEEWASMVTWGYVTRIRYVVYNVEPGPT